MSDLAEISRKLKADWDALPPEERAKREAQQAEQAKATVDRMTGKIPGLPDIVVKALDDHRRIVPDAIQRVLDERPRIDSVQKMIEDVRCIEGLTVPVRDILENVRRTEGFVSPLIADVRRVADVAADAIRASAASDVGRISELASETLKAVRIAESARTLSGIDQVIGEARDKLVDLDRINSRQMMLESLVPKLPAIRAEDYFPPARDFVYEPLPMPDPEKAVRRAMRSEKREKDAARRRQRRANQKADAFVRWAHSRHKAGTKLITASDFGDTFPLKLNPTCRIVGNAVRDGLFVLTDGVNEVDEDRMLDEAERLADGELDDRGLIITVEFTPAGLKRARSLWWKDWRAKWFGWLRFLKPFQIAAAWVYAGAGVLITIICNADKLANAIAHLLQVFVTKTK